MPRELQAIAQQQTANLPDRFQNLEQISQMVEELETIYRSKLLKKGTDYGKQPGVPKPFLWKPGAELLCRFYNFDWEFEIHDKCPDRAAGWYEFEVICRGYKITNGQRGFYVGMGVGICSSLETKYRYRWVSKRDIGELAQFDDADYKVATQNAIDYWRTKYGDGAAKIKRGSRGTYVAFRIDNENIADLGNTIIQQACKRAFVAFVKYATGVDRIFIGEEDIEEGTVNPGALDDTDAEAVEAEKAEPKAKANGKKTPAPAPSAPDIMDNTAWHKEINSLLSKLYADPPTAKTELAKLMPAYPNCKTIYELSRPQREDLKSKLLDKLAAKE